jgi:polyisoprenyl-teichoic acid--peptidoglycan teichoic acid transferase
MFLARRAAAAGQEVATIFCRMNGVMRICPTRTIVWVVGVTFVLLAAIAGGIAIFHRSLADNVSIGLAQHDIGSAFHRRRLNVLVVGDQADEATTDTIVLTHLDLDRRTGTLMSIPRDTWVDVPHHGHMKINSAFAFGGAAGTARAVTALTGVPIDATLAIDPRGAKQIVDALGGLNINVESDMNYDDNYGDLHIHLKKGEQFLSGGGVMQYMRFRHDAESDFGRMRRQQQVMREIVRELGQPQNWSKVPRLVALARADVKTSLSDTQLQALVELYRGVPPDNVRTLTLPSRPDTVGDASVVIVDDRWAHIIGALLFRRNEPPQDVVLVSNATGAAAFATTVVGALRGGGWNVATFIDEPAKKLSEVVGTSAAATVLGKTFALTPRKGSATILRLGVDALPAT